MTTPAWPTSLKILVSGFTEQLPDLALRSENEVGEAGVRRRVSTAPTVIGGTVQVDATTSAALDTFYRTTTEGGTLRFTITHPRIGTAYLARFTGPPSITPTAPRADSAWKGRATVAIELLGPETPETAGNTITLRGLTGTTTFSLTSQVVLDANVGCEAATGTALANIETTEIICTTPVVTYVDDDPTDEPVTVRWTYTDVDGTTWVEFNRDYGWGYHIVADHLDLPASACSDNNPFIGPRTGDEALFPFVRNFADGTITETNDDTLCVTGDPDFFALLLTSTLENGDTGDPLLRAQGFYVYFARCAMQTEDPGGGGGSWTFQYGGSTTIDGSGGPIGGGGPA